MHPYAQATPIFIYVTFRNIFDKYKPYYSKCLAWMQQITSATYTFQYHFYMIKDAKSILTISILTPLCNFRIISCAYIWISRIAFDATNTIINAIYRPRSNKGNLTVPKETASYCVWLVALYIISYIISLDIEYVQKCLSCNIHCL